MSDLIRQTKEYADLSEVVTATYYDEEYEEWSIRSITIKDVLDAVCDDYTVFLSAQHWIPVSERLPKENGWYIVTYDNVIYTKKREIKSGVSMFFEKFESNVIAWMPLPKPFKGGDNE